MNEHVLERDASLADDEIDFFKLWRIVVTNWRLLFFGPLLCGVLALGVAFFIPPTFTATTSFFLPQQQQTSASSMLQSLGALGGLAAASTGIKNPADQYVALLKSRSIQSALVDRFQLQARYKAKFKEDAIAELTGKVQVSAGKDGLMSISVTDHDSIFAAQLANAYVEELKKLLARLALTEAQQRRQFFEKQLLQTKNNLTNAELALGKTGVGASVLKSSPATAVYAVAQLQAQITAQQVKLSSLRGYATESSPEIKQALTELAALRSERAKISQTDSSNEPGGADYITRYRDFKYHETLFELFSKQYELAKVDEAREGAFIQVVDEAIPPQRKSKPKKGSIAVTTAISSWFLLLIFVFVRQAGGKARGA